jgi:hypothetical protein
MAVRCDEAVIEKVWGPYPDVGVAFEAMQDLDKTLPKSEDKDWHWEFDAREVGK